MSGAVVPFSPRYNNQIQNRHHQHNHHQSHGPQSQSCQVICDSCRTRLNYPRGATRVRCSVCSFIKNVPAEGTEVAQLQCNGCGLMLMYPGQALAVKCSSCKTVTCAKRDSDDSEDQILIVQNPNTLDDNGVLGSSLSVGIRAKRRY